MLLLKSCFARKNLQNSHISSRIWAVSPKICLTLVIGKHERANVRLAAFRRLDRSSRGGVIRQAYTTYEFSRLGTDAEQVCIGADVDVAIDENRCGDCL